MRACGGISKARISTQPQPAGRAVGRIQLVDAELGAVRVAGDVDQQVAEDAIDQPRRRTSCRAPRRSRLHRDLEFVDRVGARLVHARRLAGRADEHAGEQIRQRRMIQPVADEALEQIGAPQERAVGRRRAAEHDVVAAAGAGVPAVEHELLGAQPAEARLLVQRRRVVDQLAPAARGLHVHLDHAGIGRDLDLLEARVVRRRIALRSAPACSSARGGVFDGGEQVHIVVAGLAPAAGTRTACPRGPRR